MHISFNQNDIAAFVQVVTLAKQKSNREISPEDFLELGYDHERASFLIYSTARTFKNHIENVECRDGLYYAILKY